MMLARHTVRLSQLLVVGLGEGGVEGHGHAMPN